ncbi:hypothetical protein TNCV_3766951 [Trichonephila clavipes]|nr:hypothetical protein TNCV_3766951 [Trichonephila clavipes]
MSLLAKDLVTWQAMVGRHILEDIVGKVAQTTKDDRVSQEIAPHTVTPCEIAVCRLDNKCRIEPLAGAPPDTCAVVIITETESGFITEDDTSPVCHTQVARGRQNPVDTAYDVGSVVSVLSGRRLLKPISVSRLLMVSLDGTGCLKEVSGVESMLVTLLVPKWPLFRLHDPRDHLCSWDVLILRDGTLYLL